MEELQDLSKEDLTSKAKNRKRLLIIEELEELLNSKALQDLLTINRLLLQELE